METRLREQLSETERRLSEARREQAKAGKVWQGGLWASSRKVMVLTHRLFLKLFLKPFLKYETNEVVKEWCR